MTKEYLMNRVRITRSKLGCCWEWQKYRDKQGYGRLSFQGKCRTAHRVAAHLWQGFSLHKSKLVIRHRCDNPACINPEHLVQGTQWDNVKDAVKRGRHRNPSPAKKLTAAQVEDIRASRRQGVLLITLARKYGITSTTVSRIARYESWKGQE